MFLENGMNIMFESNLNQNLTWCKNSNNLKTERGKNICFIWKIQFLANTLMKICEVFRFIIKLAKNLRYFDELFEKKIICYKIMNFIFYD